MIQRWPTWAEKQATLQRLEIDLYENQEQASRVLTGRRLVPSVVQVIGGERAGKSAWTGIELCTLLPWCELIFIAGAEYENCEPEFGYLEDCLRTLGALDGAASKPKHGMWQMKAVQPFGTEIRTVSLAKLGSDALIATGRAPDVIAMCEAGMLEQDHFLAAYTRAAEKRGGIILSGTLKRAKPWYVALYRQMQGANPYGGKSLSFPSWQNRNIYPGGLDDPVIQAMRSALGETRFMERIGAEPVPSPLLVFGQQFDYSLHVKHLAYDPELPIWLACDPGYAGAYALLVVQASGSSDVRVIDEYYAQYATWDKALEWLISRPYIEHDKIDERTYMVHGIERAVMDIAGTQHHADVSQVEQWRNKAGIPFRSNPVGIEIGISRLRDFLRSPFAWDVSRISIDPKCEGLLWELGEGEQYPKDKEGNPVKEAPLDAHNHSRKALSYLLVDAFGKSDDWKLPDSVPGEDPYKVLDSRRGDSGPGKDLGMVDDKLRFVRRERNRGSNAAAALRFGR